jgi:tetratricopeptide (TPR) repeat protein
MKPAPVRTTTEPNVRFVDQGWFLGVALVFITFIAYLPVWQAGFIWDDDNFLLNNPLIREADGLYRLWFTTTAPDYFPLTSTTLWLEWRLWGEKPLGYHLVNVLLHAFSAMMAWRILARLNVPMAWLAAAVFAVHPVNVESVAWITERKNTLAMFFYMAALLAYVKFDASRRRSVYWISVGLFVLALLSKTAVVMLPFVILGIAWWRRGRIRRGDIWRSVPFFAAALVLGLVTVWFQYNRSIGEEVVRTDSLLPRVAGAGWATWFYLFKAMLPVNLAFVYPRWQINSANVIAFIPSLLVLLVLIGCWLARRQLGRGLFAAFCYFVLLLLPVLGFLNIYFMRYSLVADHWQYFAILGPIVFTVAGIGTLLSRRLSLRGGQNVFGIVLLVILGMLTWRQAGTYKDVETLWRRTLAVNPTSAMAHNALGDEMLRQGRIEEAWDCFEKSLALQPNDPLVYNNLATASVRQGRFKDAIGILEKALSVEVPSGEAHNNLAWFLATCPVGAVRDGTRAVELASEANRRAGERNPLFMDTLAAAYAEAGEFPKAVATAQRAYDLAVMLKNLGLAENLRTTIALYESGAPFRDQSLVADGP